MRASRGKNLAEYGSNRSSTTRSRSLADSVCRSIRSGSSGSGLVATPAQYVSTSDLVCHDGNSTLSLNSWQDVGSITRPAFESVCRTAVEDGSKPSRAGVKSAFRFWVIESSIVDLERLRKSRSTRSLKQNCGLSPGAGVEEARGIFRLSANPFCCSAFAAVFQSHSRLDDRSATRA